MKKISIFVTLAALSLSVAAATPLKQSKALKSVKHVVLIGSDGFSASVVRNNPGAFPNIEKLMAGGSSTLEARSVLPSSSAVNWKSMLSGAGPEIHGYTEWGSQKPELPSRVINKWGIFPSIFSVLRDSYPDAVICGGYTWDGIGYLYEEKATTRNINAETDRQLCDSMVSYITNLKPMFTFIGFSEPDETGHSIGWETPEYIDMCKTIDAYVGEIVTAVDKADIRNNTIIIFTADHGGINKGHGEKSMTEMQIPFVINGPGVGVNKKIEDSIMQFDCAANIAYILNIETPQVWIGRPTPAIYNTK